MSAPMAAGTARSSPDEADRPWLRAYPADVPAVIDPDTLRTIVDLLREAASRYPERPALESFGIRLSYAELAATAGHVASWLVREGVRPGDRVAIMMPNVMAYPPTLFGILLAGATVVNVNPLYTPRELVGQLRDSGTATIVVLENFARTVEAACREVGPLRVVIARPGDLLGPKGVAVDLVWRFVKRAVPAYNLPDAVPFARVIREGRRHPPPAVPVGPDDVAFLQYTGGTTGTAKGATLTHRNVAANVLQCEAWMRPVLGGQEHVMVTALPLYHIFALTTCGLVMLRFGGCQLLIANPRDIPGFVKILKTRPFTCLSGVNTLYDALARAPGIEAVDFRPLVLCVSGGTATQAAVAERWKALTGHPIVEGYGLSETSPVVTVNRCDIPAFTGTIGYPVPSTLVSIRDGDGRPVPAGSPGEVCVGGPQVMRGYWNKSDETLAAFTADGFFRTGDIGLMEPDGAIRIVDRMKDMAIVSGFNVYPNEVEGVLVSCPGVAEAAVIGIPDARTGEAVKAFVVRRDPALTVADVTAWCRERLTPYKVPRTIVFRDDLPKTNVGKVLRRALRDPPSGEDRSPSDEKDA